MGRRRAHDIDMESQANSTETRLETTGSPSRAVRGAGFEEVRRFFVTLLEAQCRLVGASGGVVVLAGTRARPGGLVARHALGGEADRDARLLHESDVLARLERLATRAMRERDPADHESAGVWESASFGDRGGLYDTGSTHVLLAAPLVAEGRVEGACVLLVPASARIDPDVAIERVALTAARFESFLWRQQCMSEAEQRTKLRETLELLDTALQGADAEAMGALMCHELARRFGCTRVSIGLIQHDRIRLASISGADNVDRKGAAIEAIEAAMEECADQDAEILYPMPREQAANPAERRVVRAHEQLSSRFGPSAMLSLPLRVDGGLVGVVLLEREAHDEFPIGSAPLLRLVSEFIGPALWTRRMADRGVLRVTRDRAADLGRALVGPRHTGKKLLALLALTLLALSMVPFPGRMGADAEVKASVSRTIAPPFSGFLGEVGVRPGDDVEAGEVLARMDTNELVLNRAELAASLERMRVERNESQRRDDFVKVRSLEAQIAEVRASIDKIDGFREGAEVRAPVLPKPPTIRTLPLGSTVAVWSRRARTSGWRARALSAAVS